LIKWAPGYRAAVGKLAVPRLSKRAVSDEQLDQVTGGKIEEVKVNGGGNTPKGQANGVPSENQNPAGHAPPGHN
jgi:hypothetical protein